jgi:HSP90 family molecular chaperone
MTQNPVRHESQAKVKQLLDHSLYCERAIYLRELLSNASERSTSFASNSS